jgi:hypothetical protein
VKNHEFSAMDQRPGFLGMKKLAGSVKIKKSQPSTAPAKDGAEAAAGCDLF